jgi:iron complex transport system permease protein
VRIASKNRVVLIILPLVACAIGFASLFLGRYPISVGTMVRVLASRFIPITPDWDATVETVIFNIRLPRVLLAMCIGAGLSTCGATFQGMFQNPLVSPDILGVTAGAGFGAALGILLDGNLATIQLFALVFGVLAVAITYLISRVYRTTPTLMLVLSGIVVGSIFAALLSLAKYVADPNQKLPAIVFWLMGSLAAVSKKELLYAAPPMVVGMGVLLSVRWRINLLSMGDDQARALGVNTEIFKTVLVAACTAVTACGVSVCGIIGWVGLVIPHIGRMLVGPNHKALLPASLALGAIYLVVIDDIARSAMQAEIPLGILTAIIGAPFFAIMLRKTRGGWS